MASGRNTDVWAEYRIVGLLAYRPGEIDDFGDLNAFLTDGFAIAALKAVRAVRSPDIDQIARLIQVEGFEMATPTMVKERLFAYVDDFESANLAYMYESLGRLSRMRTSAPLFAKAAGVVEIGKIKPIEAWEELGVALGNIPGTEESVRSVSTDEWGGQYADDVAAEQKRLVKISRVATFPPEYTEMCKRIKFLIGRVIGILLDTGGGKTIVAADILPHHWAAQNGRNVDVFLTETSLDEIRWRHEIRAISRAFPDTDPPTLDMLEEGYRDDRCKSVTQPYRSGGRVRYYEAGGMPLNNVLSIARRNNADIVLDVIHDINMPGEKGEREDIKIMRGLQRLATYAKKNNKNVVFTVQTDKVGRRNSRGEGTLDPSDVRGGGVYEDKSDLFFVGQFRKLSKDVGVKHPVHKNVITYHAGGFLPAGYFTAAKGRKGGSGWRQYVWREGKYFDIRGIVPEDIPYYQNVM